MSSCSPRHSVAAGWLAVAITMTGACTSFGDVTARRSPGPSVTASAADDRLRCHGFRPTIVGTPGDDHLAGTIASDVIFSGAGDDVVTASPGNDLVCGGPGADRLRGGHGGDSILGGAGADLIRGGRGHDIRTGGDGNDDVRGGADRDTFIADPGNDRLVGWTPGGKRGRHGGCCDAVTWAFHDFGIVYDGPVTADLVTGIADSPDTGHDVLVQIHTLFGSTGTDWLAGDAGSNFLRAEGGDDVLIGRGGRDSLDNASGGVRSDHGQMRGGPGDDTLSVFTGAIDIRGGSGRDYLDMSAPPGPLVIDLPAGTMSLGGAGSTVAGIEDVDGTWDDDVMTGDAADNRFYGVEGVDRLVGRGGDDYLTVGGGGRIDGGAGDDRCVGAQHAVRCERIEQGSAAQGRTPVPCPDAWRWWPLSPPSLPPGCLPSAPSARGRT
jgi:Ca2+-binding RTX toxin-like protein